MEAHHVKVTIMGLNGTPPNQHSAEAQIVRLCRSDAVVVGVFRLLPGYGQNIRRRHRLRRLLRRFWALTSPSTVARGA